MRFKVILTPNLIDGVTAEEAEIDEGQVGQNFEYIIEVDDMETHDNLEPDEQTADAIAVEKALDEFHDCDCPIGVLDYVEIKSKVELIEGGTLPSKLYRKRVPGKIAMLARVRRSSLEHVDVVAFVDKGASHEMIELEALKAAHRHGGEFKEGDVSLSVQEYRTRDAGTHIELADLGDGVPFQFYNLILRMWGAIENGTVQKQHTVLRQLVRQTHEVIEAFGDFYATEFGLLLEDLASGDYEDVEKRVEVLAETMGIGIDPDPLQMGTPPEERIPGKD